MSAQFDEGTAHYAAGRLEEAEACFERALDDDRMRALQNLGVIYRATGRLDAAEAALREALVLRPGEVFTRYTLGMTLLQLGQYAEGWEHFEARHALLSRVTAPLPEWRGESLTGKRILVIAEQGLGDQVLWSRFVPLLSSLAAEVGLAVARPLVPLLQGLAPRVFNPQTFDGLRYDVWASMGSVPRWLGVGPDDAPAPYLRRPAPAGAPQGIGLMLDGGPRNPNPARLPQGAPAERIRALAGFTDLDPRITGDTDFGRTADRMMNLEKIVTVDTSVAHVAGALGRPCIILLPRPGRDWYTSWSSDRTPWYPSARLIRQPHPGDWDGVTRRLAEILPTVPSELNET